MAQSITTNMISQTEREDFINSFPCFSAFTQAQKTTLAMLMQEILVTPNEKIVIENAIVDSIYIIAKGEAEVTQAVKRRHEMVNVLLAVLQPGEAIGLNDTGFYSSTGRRTATVTALSDMLLLRIKVQDLYEFLKQNNLESSMYAASLHMLRMRLIKQSLPFVALSHERLHWLAERVEEIAFSAGEIIFEQGEKGDKCYLIRSGQVEILLKDEKDNKRQIALLKSPQLFGEATLITNDLRNATARAQTDVDMLVLSREYLFELIESENNIASMFMRLMLDRSRPVKNPIVTEHPRTTADGQELTILKNSANGAYFKLSQEGKFIWESLDGQHTLQDLTLSLAEKFKLFAPDMVVALISKLSKSGFINNLNIQNHAANKKSWLEKTISIVKFLFEKRFAFGDADQFITHTYKKYIRYLFTRSMQIIFAITTIIGLIAFSIETPNVLLFFSFKHASLFLLLGLIPLSLIAVLLHELGHAYAVKAFNREVHYIGVGWRGLKPMAFTDTSDMWLATRKPRVLVNLAGVYVDVLIAGICALILTFISNPYAQAMLWLFALYTYIGAIRMLSPLQETDGYYVLMDWVEKTHLREAAVIWLVKIFPKSIRHPSLFRKYLPEIYYWLACIIFLIVITCLTYTLQLFVLEAFEIRTNSYFSLILPFAVMIFSSFRILIEIHNQSEE